MVYREIIHVRAVTASADMLAEAIRQSAADLEDGSHVEVFRCSDMPADIAVHVVRENGPRGPSPVCERLASELRERGMVHVSVWEASNLGGSG